MGARRAASGARGEMWRAYGRSLYERVIWTRLEKKKKKKKKAVPSQKKQRRRWARQRQAKTVSASCVGSSIASRRHNAHHLLRCRRCFAAALSNTASFFRFRDLYVCRSARCARIGCRCVRLWRCAHCLPPLPLHFLLFIGDYAVGRIAVLLRFPLLHCLRACLRTSASRQ